MWRLRHPISDGIGPRGSAPMELVEIGSCFGMDFEFTEYADIFVRICLLDIITYAAVV